MNASTMTNAIKRIAIRALKGYRMPEYFRGAAIYTDAEGVERIVVRQPYLWVSVPLSALDPELLRTIPCAPVSAPFSELEKYKAPMRRGTRVSAVSADSVRDARREFRKSAEEKTDEIVKLGDGFHVFAEDLLKVLRSLGIDTADSGAIADLGTRVYRLERNGAVAGIFGAAEPKGEVILDLSL